MKKNKNGFIQIPIIIAIIVGILTVSGVGYLGVKQYQNYQAGKKEQQKLRLEEQRAVAEQEAPKETSGDGLYNIIPESSPSRGSDDPVGEMTIKIKLKNLNVTPFITNLGTDSCTLTDSRGKKYSASFTGERKLEKALLPGEEISTSIFRGRLEVSLLQWGEVVCDKEGVKTNNWRDNEIKCIYDDSGKCTCEDIGPLKVDDCTFRISTDGKQASSGWGKYPLTVTMQE